MLRNAVALSVLVSAGCLDIDRNGGVIFSDYESLLPERLREGTVPVYEAMTTGFRVFTRSSFYRGPNGEPVTFLDVYDYQTDVEWTARGSIQKPSVELRPGADGTVAWRPLQSRWETSAAIGIDGATVALGCRESSVITVFAQYTSNVNVARFDAPSDVDWCDANERVRLGPGLNAGELLAVSFGASSNLDLVVTLNDSEPPETLVDATVSGLALPSGATAEYLAYFDVVAADTVAAVTYNASAGWLYHRGASSPLSAAALNGAPADAEPVVRTPIGTLRVVTVDGLYEWDPEGDNSVVELAESPEPTIDAAWGDRSWVGGTLAVEAVVNPEEESLRVPVNAQARILVGDTFRVIDLPTTPCADRDSCRELGESEIISVVSSGTTDHVVYEFWSWWTETGVDDTTGVRGVYTSPVP